jgi:hypothetical protein
MSQSIWMYNYDQNKSDELFLRYYKALFLIYILCNQKDLNL